LRNATTAEKVQADFEARLVALSRAHDILTQDLEGQAETDFAPSGVVCTGDRPLEGQRPLWRARQDLPAGPLRT
jgi:hypothetical protein